MSNVAPTFNPRNDVDPPKSLVRKKTFEVIARPKPEKIRVELNVEKWPAIWQPSKSKNKPQLRIFKREITLEDGNRIEASLEVSFNHLGTLTTEESKMFKALIKHWEDAGRPTTQVFFSDREIARILQKKWGTNVIESITKSLRKLRTVSLEWVNAYYDKTHEGRMLRQRQPMTFLSDLKIIERAEDGAVNAAKGYFRFDDHLLANMLANHTKPFLLDEFFQIKTDIGLLLYSHVDLIMANKNRYERGTKNLFEDLGLQNTDYQLMNKRKRALTMPIKELVGRRISSGLITSAIVVKTQDKKDYKIVIEKTSARAIVGASENDAEPAPAETATHGKQPDELIIERQAEELVCGFHKVFHGVDRYRPQSKERSQAISLIATHGYDQAQYIINFSRVAAEQTKYKPQTFGGILQYASRAAAQFQEARIAQERSRRVEAERAEIERLENAYDTYIKTALDAYITNPANEAEIAALTTAQQPVIRQKYPFMTPVQHEGLASQMIRHNLRSTLGLMSKETFFARERSVAVQFKTDIADAPEPSPGNTI